MNETLYISGLDLGQAADYSAIVVAEQTAVRDAHGGDVAHYAIRHIHRWPLGTGYPAIVADLKELFATKPLAHSRLVVDATGVGRPVVDMIRLGGINATVLPFTITAGHKASLDTTPKKDLVGSVQAALGTRRLKIAPGLPMAEVLAKELESFRATITPDRNETFAAWRERDHDDLVLALALGVWFGERIGPPTVPFVPYIIPTPFLDAM